MNASVIDNVIGIRLTGNTCKMRSDAEFAIQENPERVLSVPPKAKGSKNPFRKTRWRSHAILEVLLLAVLVVGGIAVIVALRELGAEFGVIWLGDD